MSRIIARVMLPSLNDSGVARSRSALRSHDNDAARNINALAISSDYRTRRSLHVCGSLRDIGARALLYFRGVNAASRLQHQHQ